MSKQQAIVSVAALTSGTVALLIGNSNYKTIEAVHRSWLLTINDKEESFFNTCENWMDVLKAIGVIGGAQDVE